MDCKVKNEEEGRRPEIPFDVWQEIQRERLRGIINEAIASIGKERPKVLVMEIGHFKLPLEEENYAWAKANVDFASLIAGDIIRKYQRSVRMVVTLLVNNLDTAEEHSCNAVIDEMFEGLKYIPRKSVKVVSERNLKNRAYKALKKHPTLAGSFIHIDGKAYLKDEEYQHDLAAGFVDEKGDIIPRCGLILTSYLDRIAELAKARAYPHESFEVIFLSFCEAFHEYQRVKLGVDIYASTHDAVTFTPIVLHWNYNVGQALISYRKSHEKVWTDLS